MASRAEFGISNLLVVNTVGEYNSRRLHQDCPMESHYFVSLKKTEEGYSVWVPGLPGCASQGLTEQEALANVQDAIREYLDVAEELGAEGDRREVAVTR